MIRGLLVTHGSLGDELLRAGETILGPQSEIRSISNRDTSLETLSDLIRPLLGTGEDPVYLFVDLLGGSCGHACRSLAREHEQVVVFSGVNLPMVIEFLHYRGRVPREELETRILKKGHDGIQKL